MTSKFERADDSDSRLECIEADGGGHHAEYKVKGRDDVMLQYDIQESNPMYPWTPIPIENGRMMSGIVNSYPRAYDALEAIEDGSWKD